MILGALLIGAGTERAEAQTWVPTGKQVTDRSVYAAAVLEASPERVYELWTTPGGVRQFLGVGAEIDGTVGGAYEIYFLPRDHPEAAANSTAGARLLRAEPGRFLAFEWAATPLAAELDEGGLALWVEVALEPLGTEGDRTELKLTAHGFGHGGSWDAVYRFDSRAWPEIVLALDRALVPPK